MLPSPTHPPLQTRMIAARIMQEFVSVAVLGEEREGNQPANCKRTHSLPFTPRARVLF